VQDRVDLGDEKAVAKTWNGDGKKQKMKDESYLNSSALINGQN